MGISWLALSTHLLKALPTANSATHQMSLPFCMIAAPGVGNLLLLVLSSHPQLCMRFALQALPPATFAARPSL
jgi:hypothetical protein